MSVIYFEKIESLRYSNSKYVFKEVQTSEDKAMKLFKIFFIIALFTHSLSYSVQSLFQGVVQYPSKIVSPSPFPIFYKGSFTTPQISKDMQLPKKGVFELYEDRASDQFHLLITEKIKFPDSADFKQFETDGPYRLFKFVRSTRMKELITTSSNNDKPVITLEEVEYWKIEETNTLDENGVQQPRSIPEDTILFYTNPLFIDKIESDEWKSDDIYIKLPKIFIDEHIEEKILQEVNTRMLFAAVDLRCFHTKITKTTKPYAQNCIISVRDPLNCYISNHKRS